MLGRSMGGRAAIAAGFLLAGLCVARAADASPEDIFGYGPRSPAMGGTGVAFSDSFEAAYTNPALLARLREKRLTLGMVGASFDLHADGAGEAGKVSYEQAKGVVIGADLPLPFGGVLKDRIGVGAAFYTPSDVIVRGRILYPETPQFPIVADRTQSLMIRIGMGVDLGKGLLIGAGFAALAEIVGSVVVATDASGHVGSRVEDQLIATYAPSFAVAWDLPFFDTKKVGQLRVGLVYRGTLDARFSVEIDATKLSTLNLPVFNIAGMAQYDPAQVAFEVSDRIGPLTVAVGLTYRRWSDYPGLLEPTIVCPASSPDCGALQPAHIPFSDVLVPRVGVERTFAAARGATVALRGGFFYEPSPVPGTLPASQAYSSAQSMDVSVPTRFYDAARFVFSIGGGIALAKPLPPINIDSFIQLHVLENRHVDPGGGSTGADLSGTVLAAGLLAGVRF